MKPKSNQAGDINKSNSFDRCQTPFYAVDPILPYLNKSWVIWEPAAGDGYIVDKLHQEGYNVISSDILTGGNFFSYQPDNWDCLVTNPPYSIKYKWIERCYLLGKPFALIMPVEVIGAAAAQNLFKRYGVEVIWLSSRVNFKMPNKGWNGSSAQFPTAWFTWGLDVGQQMTFANIVKYPNEQVGIKI